MRTTIIANDHLLLELRGIAQRMGKSLTEVITDALQNYIKRVKKTSHISFTGIGHTKSTSPIARFSDHIVAKAVKKREGF